MRKLSAWIIVLFVTMLVCALGVDASGQAAKQEKKETSDFDKSEELARQYLDAFNKSGVPTPTTVESVTQKAKTAGTIAAWTEAAAIANSYANVVDVLTDHYSTLYYASRSGSGGGNYSYIKKAAAYETMRNSYLKKRNDAYIALAMLYLAKGDKAKALSYLVTAVKLSEAEPNIAAENLIKQIVECSE